MGHQRLRRAAQAQGRMQQRLVRKTRAALPPHPRVVDDKKR